MSRFQVCKEGFLLLILSKEKWTKSNVVQVVRVLKG